jgi:hypothetical protein
LHLAQIAFSIAERKSFVNCKESALSASGRLSVIIATASFNSYLTVSKDIFIFQIPNSKFQIPNSKIICSQSGIWNLEFGILLCKAHFRFVRAVAFAAQNGATDFGLKRDVIVFAAIVADDFKSARRVFARRRFFRAAFRASLRRRHISLVENFLLFLGKEKDFLALNTRNFNIRHRFFSFLELTLS